MVDEGERERGRWTGKEGEERGVGVYVGAWKKGDRRERE